MTNDEQERGAGGECQGQHFLQNSQRGFQSCHLSRGRDDGDRGAASEKAEMVLNMFDNIREDWLENDCTVVVNETLLVRKLLSGRRRKAYSIFELNVNHSLKCNFFFY